MWAGKYEPEEPPAVSPYSVASARGCHEMRHRLVQHM